MAERFAKVIAPFSHLVPAAVFCMIPPPRLNFVPSGLQVNPPEEEVVLPLPVDPPADGTGAA